MLAAQNCAHRVATLVFERSGTRLRPKVFMVERCMDCNQELDRKRFPSSYDVYSKRVDK